MEFSLVLPYPTVQGQISNSELLDLYDLYAGRFSELTAVTTYSYQMVITQKCKLERIFEGLAVTEMVHLNKLANAIFAFGGDPVYAGKHSYFSGSYAEYERDLKEIILKDAEAERQAITAYKQLAGRTQNQSLLELLTRIALDEELHLNILQGIYNEILTAEQNGNCG